MIEPFSGGLVTARDALLLQAGELQQCDNMTYRPGDTRLHKTRGRAAFNAVALVNPIGLRGCAFDNGDALLVTQAGGEFKKSRVGFTGEFDTLTPGTIGDTLGSVCINNEHFLFNGAQNIVLHHDGTTRPHGLKPQTQAPGIVVTTSGGTWPLTDTLPAYYEYWAVEVYKTDEVDIEGTFVGTPATAYIPTSAAFTTVTQPKLVNPQATHWRIYRSDHKADLSAVSFPHGWLIATLPITVLTFDDNNTTASTTKFPTATSTAKPPWFTGSGAVTWTAWTLSPDNILASDGAMATSPVLSGVFANTTLTLRNFGFTTADPVLGFNVEIKCRTLVGNCNLIIAASPNGGVTLGPSGITVPITSVLTTFVLSGNWGRSWTSTELVDGAFTVFLAMSGAGSGPTQIEVDYLKVTASTGTAKAVVTPFPSISVSYGDATYTSGSNGAPPRCDTASQFEGSFVSNDLDAPNLLRYSIAGKPDYVPKEYYLPIETDDRDAVRLVKGMGGFLIAGTYSALNRVDTLPRATDDSFDRGRVVNPISNSRGVVGPRAACLVDIPTLGLVLAYISRFGPMISDGYTADTATEDLKWERHVDVAKLNDCELINYPKEYKLTLYFTPPDGTTHSQAFDFHYHPMHLKNGKMKVSGPHTVSHIGATRVVLDDGTEMLFTADTNGIVHVEDEGVSTEESVVMTREIYPAGVGQRNKLGRLMVHHSSATPIEVQQQITLISALDDDRTLPETSFTTKARGWQRQLLQTEAVGLALRLRTTGDISLNVMDLTAVPQAKE